MKRALRLRPACIGLGLMVHMLPIAATADVFPARTFEQLCRDVGELRLPTQRGMQDDVPDALKILMSDSDFTAGPDTYDSWGNIQLNMSLRMLSEDHDIGSKDLSEAFFSQALLVRSKYDDLDRKGSLWTFQDRHGWSVLIHQAEKTDDFDPTVTCIFAEKAPHSPDPVMDAILAGGFAYTPGNQPNLNTTKGLSLAFFADDDSQLTVSLVDDMPDLTSEFGTYGGSIVLDYTIYEPSS